MLSYVRVQWLCWIWTSSKQSYLMRALVQRHLKKNNTSTWEDFFSGTCKAEGNEFISFVATAVDFQRFAAFLKW